MTKEGDGDGHLGVVHFARAPHRWRVSNESGEKSHQPTKEKLAISQSQGPSLWKAAPPEIRTDPLLFHRENISITLLCPLFTQRLVVVIKSDELRRRFSKVTTCLFSSFFFQRTVGWV